MLAAALVLLSLPCKAGEGKANDSPPEIRGLDLRASPQSPGALTPAASLGLPPSALTAEEARAAVAAAPAAAAAVDAAKARVIWRDQVAPHLDPQAQTHSIFYAYLQAGDYPGLAANLPSTRKKLDQQASLGQKLTGRSPAKAIDQLMALVAGQKASPVAELAGHPERFRSRQEYYRFLQTSVKAGDISGYYARLSIGRLPDYASDSRAPLEMARYSASFNPR